MSRTKPWMNHMTMQTMNDVGVPAGSTTTGFGVSHGIPIVIEDERVGEGCTSAPMARGCTA